MRKLQRHVDLQSRYSGSFVTYLDRVHAILATCCMTVQTHLKVGLSCDLALLVLVR